MKKLLYILSFIPLLTFGQARLEWLVNDFTTINPNQRDLSFHTSIRPQIQSSYFRAKDDTLPHLEPIKTKKTLSLLPLADLGFRSAGNSQYRAMLGAGLEFHLGSKLYARATYLQGIEKAENLFVGKNSFTYPIDSVRNQKIDLRGRVSYSPNKFFNFQGGWDNQFIGEGNRSLFLSDYGKPQGFAMARMNFWRVEYVMMYQYLQEKNINSDRVSKFASTHYVSFNAAPWLQFGLFESVVFQPKDTLLNRGFEPEYLNPMIFYRPQEYALGSADNVLIGIDAKVNIGNLVFYTQLMMDEFDITQIKGRTRWWANKYAFQLGVKRNYQLSNHRFFVRGEMNIIRPYTYAHLSLSQSYTNQGLPLAHPNGANYSEILVEGHWKKDKWQASIFASYSLKGLDTSAVNWGGNITIPYINRPVELNDFGHTIGQGQGNNSFKIILRGSYRILESSRLDAFVEGQFRSNTYLQEPKGQIFVGIRSQLWNDYRNY